MSCVSGRSSLIDYEFIFDYVCVVMCVFMLLFYLLTAATANRDEYNAVLLYFSQKLRLKT